MTDNNQNTKQTIMKAGIAASAAAVAGILISKKGEDLNTEEFAKIVEAMKNINTTSIDQQFCYGYKGKNVANFELEGNEKYKLGVVATGTKTEVAATVIKNEKGQIIGYYYKNNCLPEDTPMYTVHYNGQTYRNATWKHGTNDNTLSDASSSPSQDILTVDPISNSVSANGKVIGTATPPPSNGSTNFVVYEKSAGEETQHVTGFVETTTGQGFFEGGIGHGTQRDSVAQVKNLYLTIINQKVTEGDLDPKIDEELRQYVMNMPDSSVRTCNEFNQLLNSKISDMKGATNFKKGYEAICNAFDNSSLIKEINEFAGTNVITASGITTIAVVGGLIAVGATLARNADSIKKGIDKTKKLVLSSPSSLSNKSNSNVRSK